MREGVAARLHPNTPDLSVHRLSDHRGVPLLSLHYVLPLFILMCSADHTSLWLWMPRHAQA